MRRFGGPPGSVKGAAGPPVLPVHTSAGRKIQNLGPTISPQPKPGQQPRLYHRTQRLLMRLYQRLAAPYHRCTAVYLPAAISPEPEPGSKCQAQKNDRDDELYRMGPFPALFLESPPGGMGANSRNLPPEGQGRPAGLRRKAWDGPGAIQLLPPPFPKSLPSPPGPRHRPYRDTVRAAALCRRKRRGRCQPHLPSSGGLRGRSPKHRGTILVASPV